MTNRVKVEIKTTFAISNYFLLLNIIIVAKVSDGFTSHLAFLILWSYIESWQTWAQKLLFLFSCINVQFTTILHASSKLTYVLSCAFFNGLKCEILWGIVAAIMM